MGRWRRIVLLFAWLLCGAIARGDSPPPAAPSKPSYEILLENFEFTPLSYTFTGKGYKNREFHYRLFDPKLGSDEPLPLIVWLHGMGESSDENKRQLIHLDEMVFRPPYNGKKVYPFYMLLVQCPGDNHGWTTYSKRSQDDMIDVAYEVMQDVLTKYPIDRARISLVGISSGGWGGWEMLRRHPDVFSSFVSMEAHCHERNVLETVRDIPIWMFHNKFDGGCPIENPRKTYEALKEMGATVSLTQFPKNGHECWTESFGYPALDWILSQRRLDQGSAGERIGYWLTRNQVSSVLLRGLGILALAWGTRRIWRR